MNVRPVWRKKRWAVPALVIAMLVIVAGFAWTNRIDIADGYITDQLEASGLSATYEIVEISGQTQILSDLVIGDPAAPDLTVERVIVRLRQPIGLPQVAGVTLVNPRIYGRYGDEGLTFGSLDSLIFEGEGASSGLPDIDLVISDGRGLIESEFGPVGLKVEGRGNLANGFAGYLAASAPQLLLAGCDANGTSLYGDVTTDAGEARFEGPLRVGNLQCRDRELAIEDFAANLELTSDGQFSEQRLVAQLSSGTARIGETNMQSLAGTVRARLQEGTLNARHSLALRGVETTQALVAVLTAEGTLRARDNFARFELESDIEGNGLRLGPGLIATIESFASAGGGTLLEPIAQQIGASLQRETRGSALAGTLRYRFSEDGSALIVPQTELRGGSGARLLSLSRFELSSRGDEPSRVSGNVATGGPGLPSITGRMETTGAGDAVFRLSMAPYQAGVAVMSVPQLSVVQGISGALGFSGRALASGPLPGGAVELLSVPLSGRLDTNGDLAMWRDCTEIGFRRLAIAQLNLAGSGLSLCPSGGQPILQYGSEGLRVAAATSGLDLAGTLGDSPLRIASGPVGFAYPGTLTARDLDVTLGPAEGASNFEIAKLDAAIGETIAGSFANADIALSSVPMTLVNTAGEWNYADGQLGISDAKFRLVDREDPARFEPLAARGAILTLADNRIDAEAELRHPGSDRIVTTVDIRHDLSNGAGFANLDVADLVFDEALQPVDLTYLALGVVANAEGSVRGRGRIDWTSAGEIASSGTFSTDDFDFAAAFGPVKGVSGTIEFTDLLNLTTAPGQKLRIASINPGIEVFDGEIEYQWVNSQLLRVAGGRWPFMGGELILRPFDFNFGISEERSYVFEIVGLDAGQFVAQMELENISATGTFDGTVPIIFDRDSNGRIEEGILLSRPPGGNISYVGELTYEDLSAIGNYAFGALRSLEYSQMRLVMEGPLTGEIITRVRFDGVRQGADADKNFITRQLAKIPIQFRINIRAQFYQLLTSVKAMYDPSSVRDPRELGLLSDDGTRLRRSISGEDAEPDIDPEDVIPDEPTIQDQESE